jgi:predicted outer membrane repeat protein
LQRGRIQVSPLCKGGLRGVKTSQTRSDGGAIFSSNGANLSITNSTLSGNSATGSGGAIFHNLATSSITNSIIIGNTATNGAEIFNNANNNTNSKVTGSFGGVYPSREDANNRKERLEEQELEDLRQLLCLDSSLASSQKTRIPGCKE